MWKNLIVAIDSQSLCKICALELMWPILFCYFTIFRIWVVCNIFFSGLWPLIFSVKINKCFLLRTAHSLQPKTRKKKPTKVTRRQAKHCGCLKLLFYTAQCDDGFVSGTGETFMTSAVRDRQANLWIYCTRGLPEKAEQYRRCRESNS